MVDNGILLETDPQVIASRVALKEEDEDFVSESSGINAEYGEGSLRLTPNCMSLYLIKAVIVLETSGKRLISKYYPSEEDTSINTPKGQEEFENKLFLKSRTQPEIVIFDGYCCVYKARQDVIFFIVGPEEENELLLFTALSTLRDTLDILLSQETSDNAIADKLTLLENLDFLLLSIDEMVDNGILLETDPQVIASRVALKEEDEDFVSEQTVSSVLDQASDFARALLSGF
eukprot:TRINITY_DN6962_c0_g1_i1.p1 TRINITY_DN6962_c0_g1~~TRINITY_DN6962_c0_g1_i1.p1  ORF type:complete len:264 (-),score=58.27 TRINITY_DN6962_c0_g1_i1:51-746(-)